MSDVFVRTVSGLALLAVLALLLYLGHLAVVGMVLGVQVVVFREVLALGLDAKLEPQLGWGLRLFPWLLLLWALFTFDFAVLSQVPLLYPAFLDVLKAELIGASGESLAAGGPLPLLLAGYLFLARYHHVLAFGFGAGLFALFVLQLRERRHFTYLFRRLSWSIFSVLLAAGATHVAIYNVFYGFFWLLFPVLLVAANDTGAYLCGRAFGRTALIPRLSPNKTVEGYVGAAVLTLVTAVLVLPLLARVLFLICPAEHLPFLGLDAPTPLPGSLCGAHPISAPLVALFEWQQAPLPYWLQPVAWVVKAHPKVSDAAAAAPGDGVVWIFNYLPIQLHAVVFSLAAAFIAPFGGFFASGLKRAFNVKDFGHIIPGHGGLLDRIDCLLVMIAFTYIYLQVLQPSTPGKLLHELILMSPEQRGHALGMIRSLDPSA